LGSIGKFPNAASVKVSLQYFIFFAKTYLAITKLSLATYGGVFFHSSQAHALHFRSIFLTTCRENNSAAAVRMGELLRNSRADF
jgi:hypothetical protein